MNGSRAWLEKDFYAMLGVGENASADEIKRAYKRLARTHHPDRNPGDKQAEERMKEISEAYDVLSDSAKRSEYDQFRRVARSGWVGGDPSSGWQTTVRFDDLPFDVEDLFGSMFGGGRGRGGAPGGGRARRGADVEASVRVPFEDAVRGTTLTVPTSDGPVQLKVPPGISDGARLRARGRGRGGAAGAGDLYVLVEVLPDPRFARAGDDLTTTVSVPFTVAALGGTVEAPTLDGSVTLRVPAGTSSGRTFRVRGKGVPGKGDLLVTVQISVPAVLSDEERALIEQLAALRQRKDAAAKQRGDEARAAAAQGGSA